MKRLRVKKKRKKLNIGVLLMLGVIALLCIILGSKMLSLYNNNKELQAQEKLLLTKLDEEKQRTEDLEERRVYVQTNKFVEEVAKSLGFVYPDEFIFKASN